MVLVRSTTATTTARMTAERTSCYTPRIRAAVESGCPAPMGWEVALRVAYASTNVNGALHLTLRER